MKCHKCGGEASFYSDYHNAWVCDDCREKPQWNAFGAVLVILGLAVLYALINMANLPRSRW